MNAVWLLVGALLLGGGMTLGSFAGNTERVTRLWVAAEVAEDGTARISEVIDYDFGRRPGSDRHGIYRDVPGLAPTAEVEATVDGRPVPAETGYLSSDETRIRIGDPGRTVSGVHRYRIEYRLDGVAPGHRLAWNAVGTGWTVPLDDIHIQVVAPFGLTGARCVRGVGGSRTSCAVTAAEPGRLTAELASLPAEQGATVYAAGDLAVSRPELPVPPHAALRAADRPHPLLPGLFGTVAALLAVALTALLLRWAGRSPLYDEDGFDGAGLGTTSGGRVRRVDLSRRAASRPPAPAPPEDLDPARAGILLAGRVLPAHKVALLMDAHTRGWLTVSQQEVPTLSRNESQEQASRTADALTRRTLNTIFGSRVSVTLGRYDYDFARAWRALDTDLREWLESAGGLSDPTGRRRSRVVRRAGVAASVIGLGTALTGAVLSGHHGQPWMFWAVTGAVIAGAGLALSVRAWELSALTPHGARLWLRVAAFRRYLARPDMSLVAALTEEEVRLYSCWAVGLGETDSWSAAAEASSRRPGHHDAYRHWHRHTSGLAASLVAAAASSSTAPSSSSGASDSSGSGSVGGGSGGGGGGSW
ncbi:DUF2207 domain-containing protein [Streptomyces sp. NPDC020403]|uniref:DUF2207 domain-containing protein n=1 Tax=unclassified Streptomyces TaxID=2593676 RepID=UPI0033E2580E